MLRGKLVLLFYSVYLADDLAYMEFIFDKCVLVLIPHSLASNHSG